MTRVSRVAKPEDCEGHGRTSQPRPCWSPDLLSLTGTLSHLSALAAETTHALLAPLGTHTTVDADLELHGVVLLQASKGTRDESLATENDALDRGWNEFNVLN